MKYFSSRKKILVIIVTEVNMTTGPGLKKGQGVKVLRMPTPPAMFSEQWRARRIALIN